MSLSDRKAGESKRRGPRGMTLEEGRERFRGGFPFRTREELEAAGFCRVGNRFVKGREVWLSLDGAKMLWHCDHRFGTYEGVTSRRSTHLPTLDEVQHADPTFLVQP